MRLFAFITKTLDQFHRDLDRIGSSIDSATAEYNAQKSNEEPAPLVRAELYRAQSEVDNEEFRASRHEERDRVRLQVEALGAVIAGILAIASILQWIETRHAVNVATISAVAAQKGAAASEDQAKAARLATQATVDAFRLDQRAWVGPIEMGINDPPIRTGSRLVATVVLTNSGKTPALHLYALTSIYVFSKDVVLTPRYKVDKTDQPSYSVLQPGMKELITTLPVETVSGSGAGVLSSGDFEDIQSGKYIVYVYGKITYRDVFQREHTTKFCGFLNRNMTTLRACKTYNEAD
jgi:hypothetical protein